MATEDYYVLAVITVAFTVVYFSLNQDERGAEKFLVGVLAAVFWFGFAAYGLNQFPETYLYVYLYVLIGIILLLWSVINILKMFSARTARA